MDAVLSASLLILVIAGLRAALLHRLPKRLLPPLWGLCLLRLVLPVPDGIALPAVSVSLPVQAAVAQSAAQSAPLPLFCGGVGALLLCYFLLQHLGCLREYREALPCENESVEAFLAAHPLRRKVRVRVLDRLSSPLTYGVFRPVILLPKQVCTEEALSFTLEHEFCHIRRFHTLYRLLLLTALCLLWWNPCVWLLYRLGCRDLELSCDEQVLLRCGLSSRASYARELIRLEERKTGFSPLETHFCKNKTEERIRAIMTLKRFTFGGLAAALLISAGAITAFATDFSLSETTAPAGTAEHMRSDASPAEQVLTLPDGQILELSPGESISVPSGGETYQITAQQVSEDFVSYTIS